MTQKQFKHQLAFQSGWINSAPHHLEREKSDVSVVRCWRMSQNFISKYLFLEQKAQSLEEVLTFLTKAGGPIHIFSESTHIEALMKPCKMMKIKKKSYLYNPNVQYCNK